MSYGRPAHYLADVSFEDAAVYVRPAFNAADSEWQEPASIEAKCKAPTMLAAGQVLADVWTFGQVQAPTMLAAGQVLADVWTFALGASPTMLAAPAMLAQLDPQAAVAAPTMLRATALVANVWTFGMVQAPTMLASSAVVASHDFTVELDATAPNIYVMDLITPGGLVRVPISSWQATIQTDVQSYVQCVVPAATDWVPDIEAATEFVITRRGALLDGSVIEYEMARAPAQTVSLNGGPYNYTATISGYTAALPTVEDPPAALDRTLAGVRTVSRNSGNVRVRCNIDWLLRPGQRAYLDEEPIVVAFVNYYVPGFDQYMDVGDRV